MMHRFATLFVLAVASYTVEGISFVPRKLLLARPKSSKSTASIKHAALEVRGGSGPLDASDTAKMATVISLVNAIIITLSPKKTCAIYGMTRSPRVEKIIEMAGSTLLALALTSYCLIFKGTSVETAVGISTFPWVVLCLRDILEETPKELGVDMNGSYLNLAVGVVSGYACLTGNNADAARKFLAIWTCANGILLALAPAKACELWGWKNPDGREKLLIKSLGYFLWSVGTMGLSLVQGVDTLKAFGYSWIVNILGVLDNNLITKGIDEYGLNKAPQYIWMVLMAIFAYTLAF
jgi:hypothetical protein